MNNHCQTVAERVTGAMGTWEEGDPLYAQRVKAQGMMIRKMGPLKSRILPAWQKSCAAPVKQRHSEH